MRREQERTEINSKKTAAPIGRIIEKGIQGRRILRGDLYYADLSPVVGSEQGGVRPVLVIQNDRGNLHSPTLIVAAVTSRLTKAAIPTHVSLGKFTGGLRQDSTVLAEQIRTIDRNRLKEYIGHLDGRQMADIDGAMRISLGMA